MPTMEIAKLEVLLPSPSVEKKMFPLFQGKPATKSSKASKPTQTKQIVIEPVAEVAV
jgi:hypothetical protein